MLSTKFAFSHPNWIPGAFEPDMERSKAPIRSGFVGT
jgi:hypothetical protein